MPYSISGFTKRVYDLSIFLRFIVKVISVYGFYKGLKNCLIYLRSNKSLFFNLPNRYIKKGGSVYAVPDVPPVNTIDFINYLFNDVALQLDKKKPTLLFAIVCISSVCPYKCSYCYNLSAHSNQQLLSYETINKTIEGLLTMGAKNIYLSGGEPMLRFEMISEILNKYSNKGLGFWLITTGWSLNKDKAIKLKEEGLRGVMISLDGTWQSHIDKIKGKGAYKNAVAAIKAASEAGLLVVADCVIHQQLLEEAHFDNYINFAASIGVDFINLYAPRIKKDFEDEERRNLSLSELKKIGSLALRNQTLRKYRHLPLAYSPDDFESRRGCLGGEIFFYVGPDGSVKACPFKQKILGNVKDKNIKEIINDYEKSGEREICDVNKILSEQIARL